MSKPPPDDAQAYAGITWSTNEIENLALEAYWLNRGNWNDIQKCFETAIRCLEPLAKPREDDDCPWPACPDGSCTPVCRDR